MNSDEQGSEANSGQPPSFLKGTFLWDWLGYFLAEPAPPILISEHASESQHPWTSLGAALEQAKAGNHDKIAHLHRWIDLDYPPLLIRGCIALLADAGTRRDIEFLRNLLVSDSRYIRLEACWAVRSAGYLWLVPAVLDAWHRADQPGERDTISANLSLLLEADTGPIGSHDEYSPSEYHRLVAEKFEQLTSRLGTAQVQMWRGSPHGVPSLARYMFASLTDPDLDPEELRVDFLTLRHRFEAASGWNCASFYHNRVFQPDAAADKLYEFINSREPAKYQEHLRYFFGHEVPT